MPVISSNASTIRLRYKIILLVCLTVLIYLPVLRSGLFIFDDFDIVEAIQNIKANEALTFLWTADGRYWRPIVMLSFLVDVNWFNASSALMHLHNVLIHTSNTLLVFFLISHFSSYTKRNENIPLFTAAIFALHPINTESVAWIAARTDLYATFFSLAGLLLYSRSINTNNKLIGWGAAFLFLLGSLSKEVGVPLFLAAAVGALLLGHKKTSFFSRNQGFSARALLVSPYLVIGTGYFLLRKSAFQATDESLAKVVALPIQSGPSAYEQLLSGLTALGFYFKKTLIPMPLNFAIDSVAGFYLWVGIATLIALLGLMLKRQKNSVLLLVALFAITPALLNAIFHIAWTPYAERYLYLPTAMLCAYCGSSIVGTKFPERITNTALLIVVFIFLTVSFQRNIQWMDYTDILADAAKKTPKNTSLSINYAIVLEDKDPEAAREQLLLARKIAPDRQVISKVLATIALNTMQDAELARSDLETFFQGEQKPSPDTLETMIKVNHARLTSPKNEGNSQLIKSELGKSYFQLYELRKKSSDLFHAVQYIQTTDDRTSAEAKLAELIKNSTNNQDKQKAIVLLSLLKDIEDKNR